MQNRMFPEGKIRKSLSQHRKYGLTRVCYETRGMTDSREPALVPGCLKAEARLCLLSQAADGLDHRRDYLRKAHTGRETGCLLEMERCFLGILFFEINVL